MKNRIIYFVSVIGYSFINTNTVFASSGDDSSGLCCGILIIGVIVAILSNTYEKGKKLQEKKEKLQREQGKKLHAARMRVEIYKKGHGHLLENFIKTYSVIGYGDSKVLKLMLLLKSKDIEISDADTLLQILKIEEEQQQYKKFRDDIHNSSPKNLTDYLNGYLKCYNDDSHNRDLLYRLLEEDKVHRNAEKLEVVSMLRDIMRKKELEMFEKNLNDNNSNTSIELIDEMSGHEFEIFLSDLYEKMGFTVEMTSATGDQGADLIAIKNGEKNIIQAKNYSNSVGNKAVQEVISAMSFYSGDRAIVVTNNFFTKSAIELAKAGNVELIDRDKLQLFIDDYY